MGKKSVEDRIAALERQVAEIRVRAVEAGEFRLVDKSGRVRAVLEMTRSGPRLAMIQEDGAVSFEVALAPDGPGLRVSDVDGNTRIFIGAQRDSGRIALADGKGKQRAFIGVGGEGRPMIDLYDAKQRRIWGAPD
jgi:hypothetical protein